MVKQLTVFETTDGKKFDNELAANGHEMSLSASKSIEAYLAAAEVSRGAKAVSKHIAGYLGFMETYVPAA